MSAGQVVFSLDFELGWGHQQTRPSYVEKLREHSESLRERIDSLISLFERYDVPATWAVVGKLTETGEDPLFHAPDLFETLITSSPDHDIGLHSYAHEFYDQLSPQAAENDLRAGIDALEEWGCQPRSFVFPQNRAAHLNLLNAHALNCYRTDSGDERHAFTRLFSPATHELSKADSAPVPVPSSMFLAANRPNWYRQRYARRGLKKAATEGELVHYWLHPHNVVTDDPLLGELESLLALARSAADTGDVSLQTMADISRDCSSVTSVEDHDGY